MTDVILMKTTEKERMEKLQYLMNKVLITFLFASSFNLSSFLFKLDSLCLRNRDEKEKLSASELLVLKAAANLADETSLSWENQQQLFGDQISLEYIQSCANRPSNKNDDIRSMLTRPARISEVYKQKKKSQFLEFFCFKISSKLQELYINEEERLKNEWNDMCKIFEQKLLKTQENLAKKCYQLYNEESLVHDDVRKKNYLLYKETKLYSAIRFIQELREEIRTYFLDSNKNVNHLLKKEVPARITTYTRDSFTNAATCLQKRAYDEMNAKATHMHKQLVRLLVS